jgi:hypothetical protein
MAGVRNVRTKEQKINDLKAKLAKVKSDMRDETRKARDKRSIIIGASLEARASKDANAKKLLDDIIAGLVRPQDRAAFDLDPLPGTAPAAAQPAAKPPAVDPLAAALAARKQAIGVWESSDKSPAAKAKVAEAMAAVERLTGKVWDQLDASKREGWGLGARPGELKNG